MLNTAKNLRVNISKAISLILIIFLTIAILSGCSNLLSQTGGEGRVVLTLKRGETASTQSGTYFTDSYDGLAGNQEIQLAQLDEGVNPAELPRSVSRVLNNISAYLVMIEGSAYDYCGYYAFADEENQLTVEMTLPAGSGYSLTLLALGGAADTSLLGAGRQEFVVTAGQTTTVPVHMLPYKYVLDYNESFSPDAGVPVSFYVLGPLMDEIFALSGEQSKVYYSISSPGSNLNEKEADHLAASIIEESIIDNYDCYQFQVQLPDNSQYFNIFNDGQSYRTNLQLSLDAGSDLQEKITQAGLSEISLLLPDLIIEETLEVVLVSPGESVNNAPELHWLGEEPPANIYDDGSRTGNEGWNLSFTVSAYDSDGDDLTFSAGGELAPYFNPDTREFNWTPADGAHGTYSTEFTVSDGQSTDSRTIDIIINDTINQLPNGVMTVIAGSGERGYSGDGGPAVYAQFNEPQDAAVDGSGNVYIADTENNRIRRVSPEGVITTIAGTGTAGYSGDGGPALSAELCTPEGIAVGGTGSIYIADTGNHCIRKIDGEGIITTVAGNGIENYSGDGGPAIEASLAYPAAVAVDGSGNIYIADTENYMVRKVDTGGTITRLAGTGVQDYSGDGGPAAAAEMYEPLGIAVDEAGSSVYIADYWNVAVRKISIDPERGNTIDTVVGAADNIGFPRGLALDDSQNLYIVDESNCLVRKMPADGTITTVVSDFGNTYRYPLPEGAAVDSDGNLYIIDPAYGIINKVEWEMR